MVSGHAMGLKGLAFPSSARSFFRREKRNWSTALASPNNHIHTEDFRRLLCELGCKDYRLMDASEIEITDEAISNKVRQDGRMEGKEMRF